MFKNFTRFTTFSSHERGFVHLILIISIVLVGVVGVAYLMVKNGQLKQRRWENINKAMIVEMPTDPTAGWKTYRNEEYELEFRYPADYKIKEENNKTTIRSTPTSCQTDVTGRATSVEGYDAEVTIVPHSGNSYSEIWNNVFGFELDLSDPEKSSDGVKTISGKTAYYFYRGAEMPYGRTAYLVKLDEGSALEINLWVPILLYNCDRPLDQLEGQKMADQILSTFKFIEGK